MNARKIIEEDLKVTITKALREGILINPRISGEFYKNQNFISSKYTRFADEEDYLLRYFKQYENGEYFATFDDGAFLQINFEFDIQTKNKSNLVKMNLCYLPAVDDYKLKKEYIRIDYDSTTDNSFFHPVAHIHLGFKGDLRLPIEDVFLFSDFLRLIIYLNYPKKFTLMFRECDYSTGNTINKSQCGTVTKHEVLTKEIANNIFLKFKNNA